MGIPVWTEPVKLLQKITIFFSVETQVALGFWYYFYEGKRSNYLFIFKMT